MKFESKAEMAQQLIAGFRFKTVSYGGEIYFDETYDNPFRFLPPYLEHSVGMEVVWNGLDLEWVKVTPWYENLHNGILCRVWDNEYNKFIAVIRSYHPNRKNAPFLEERGIFWKNAEPLTPEEVEGLMPRE